MNPLTDAALAMNDKLIAEYAAAFVETPSGTTLLETYRTIPVDICRGMFAGYVHAYSMIHILHSDHTNTIGAQIKYLIWAVCKRITEG